MKKAACTLDVEVQAAFSALRRGQIKYSGLKLK